MKALLTTLVLCAAVWIQASTAHADLPMRGKSGLVTPAPDVTVSVGTISLIVDADGDGLPDEWEVAHGLDSHDPADADQDPDSDTLSSLQEFQLGTHPQLADTDGDGVSDGDEVRLGTDPRDPNDRPGEPDSLRSLAIRPQDATLVVNTLLGGASLSLKVQGTLASGRTVDLSGRLRGTRYSSSNLAVALVDENGIVFAQAAGSAIITAANGSLSAATPVRVTLFPPQPLSVLGLPGTARRVAVQPPFAYVAAQTGGLSVVDVSIPTAPVRTGGFALADAEDVQVQGNLAYVAAGEDGLVVCDVSDPTQPVTVSRTVSPVATPAVGVRVQGNVAYVASGNSGLHLVDITDPSHPALLANVAAASPARSVDVFEDLAAVATDTKGVSLVNVSDPAHPIPIGSISGLGSAEHVLLSGILGYVSSSNTRELFAVKLVDPSNPINLGNFSSGTLPTQSAMGLGFLVTSNRLPANIIPIFSLADPEAPAFVTRLDFTRLPSPGPPSGEGIATSGIHVYQAAGAAGLRIAQLIQPNDNGTIPPDVSFQFPLPGDPLVGGEEIQLTVRAVDDVAVRSVHISVDSSPVATFTRVPYTRSFRVPSDVSELRFDADAEDLSGNIGTAVPVVASVGPDPGTTAVGHIVRRGTPVAGAAVSLNGITSVTDGSGRFSVAGLKTVPRTLVVSAATTIDGTPFHGISKAAFALRGGVTDVGTISVVPDLRGVTITLDRSALLVGETGSISVRGDPAIAAARIKLAASSAATASVAPTDAIGSSLQATITGLSAGPVVLDATYTFDDVSVTSTREIGVFDISIKPAVVPVVVPGVLPAHVQVVGIPLGGLTELSAKDPEIASVSPSQFAGGFGVATISGLRAGDTTLEVTYGEEAGRVAREFPIRVRPAAILLSGRTEARLGVPELYFAVGFPAGGAMSVSVDRSDIASLATQAGGPSSINATLIGQALGTVSLSASYAVTGFTATESLVIKLVPDVRVSGPAAVAIGGTARLEAVTNPPGATVTFSLDRPQPASIDAATGVLTGIAEGFVLVTAKAQYPDGAVGTSEPFTVQVVRAQASLLGPSTIPFGTSASYSAFGHPPGGNLVTALSPPDSAELTVISDQPPSRSVSVRATRVTTFIIQASYVGVTPTPVTSSLVVVATPRVVVTGPSVVARGGTIDLDATVEPAAPATFAVSDERIATVDPGSGVLTGVATGTVVVTAHAEIDGITGRSAPFGIFITEPTLEFQSNTQRQVLVGGTITLSAFSFPATTSIAYNLTPVTGQASLTPFGQASVTLLGVSPGTVDVVASATVAGKPLQTQPLRITVLEPPVRDIRRVFPGGSLSILSMGTVAGQAQLTDSGLEVLLSNTTAQALTLDVREIVTGAFPPRPDQFALVDLAASANGQVSFPIASGLSGRLFPFVADSATKPGGFIQLDVTANGTPTAKLSSFSIPLVLTRPEVMSLRGEFESTLVFDGGTVSVAHGTPATAEATGNSVTSSLRIEEQSVHVDASGTPVTTPTLSVVGEGLTSPSPPTLRVSLPPPSRRDLRIRSQVTAWAKSVGGTLGTSRSFTVYYEIVPRVDVTLTNTNALGGLGRTVFTTGPLLSIGAEPGASVKAVVNTDRGVQSLELLVNESPSAQEFRFDGTLTRLPSLPGTFTEIFLTPFEPLGSRRVVRSRAMLQIGQSLLQVSSPSLSVVADRRPDVTSISIDRVTAVTAPPNLLVSGTIHGTLDVADPDRALAIPNLVGFVELLAREEPTAPGKFQAATTLDVNAGEATRLPFSFVFDATSGFTQDTVLTIEAIPVDTLLLEGVRRNSTKRLGDVLGP